ncbi:MAG: glycosyltransferase family 2 protein [Acidobacteriota bacterium]|nr:glycosyltransferase family 2 protein [Acidobacteriota bacterium]
MSGGVSIALTGIVVHWHNEELLARLREAWPDDPRFELLIVDNGSREGLPEGRGRVVSGSEGGSRNRGFAGGVNRGLEEARGEIVLILNPDAEPEKGALEALLTGFEQFPDAAGLAPKLLGDDGQSQHRWQLRPLPSPWTLLQQALLLPAGAGPATEPPAGAQVEQPAAAALALRTDTLQALGGMDEGFYPAWFEDVDLARRLRDRGETLRYWPSARFRHGLGASVPRLGYGPFLWVYYRNLVRYLRLHYGRSWALAAVPALLAGMALRMLLLPLRRPRRSTSRSQAAAGLGAVMLGAVSGWRRPRRLARECRPPRR